MWKEGNYKVVCTLINGKCKVAWGMERTVAKRQENPGLRTCQNDLNQVKL